MNELKVSSVAPVAYLLNGLPSLLARRVLEQVLCFEPRARVFAIVHADDTDYTERLLSHLDNSQRARVELMTGDVTALDFGLSGAEYLALAREVRSVHHVVSSGAVYTDASNALDVGAALGREVVEFGRAAARLRSLVLYSSAGVSGDRTGTVLETELLRQQRFTRPFEQALALMERVVSRASAELPVVVVRPTTLTGDSETGECERNGPLHRLVETILALPAQHTVRIPSERSPVHLVPVDYVARVAYYLGRRTDTVGHTLHVTDAHPTALPHVLKLLLDACGHRSRQQAALRPALNPRLPAPLSEWGRATAALVGPRVFYDTQKADRMLSGSGIACPPFEDYVEKLVSFVRGKRV